jgi:hypothetical protein
MAAGDRVPGSISRQLGLSRVPLGQRICQLGFQLVDLLAVAEPHGVLAEPTVIAWPSPSGWASVTLGARATTRCGPSVRW